MDSIAFFVKKMIAVPNTFVVFCSFTFAYKEHLMLMLKIA